MIIRTLLWGVGRNVQTKKDVTPTLRLQNLPKKHGFIQILSSKYSDYMMKHARSYNSKAQALKWRSQKESDFENFIYK